MAAPTVTERYWTVERLGALGVVFGTLIAGIGTVVVSIIKASVC